MPHKAKLLIVEDSRDLTHITKTILIDKGYGVETCKKDGRAVLEAIRISSPDIVIIEMFMANLDAAATLKELSEQEFLKKPKVIVASNFDNGFAQRNILKAGADYFILKPFDYDVLCKRINVLLEEAAIEPTEISNNAIHENKLEIIITEILHYIGVPANIQGYYYLRTAIMIAVQNEDVLNRITKELYPSVAKKHGTTVSRVERSIRHCIEVVWHRGNIDALHSYFGYSVNSIGGKPKNSEFISLISDRIRLKIRMAQ